MTTKPTTWQDVMPITTCPRCGAVHDQPCWDMRYSYGVRKESPHPERIDLAKRGLYAHQRLVDQLNQQTRTTP